MDELELENPFNFTKTDEYKQLDAFYHEQLSIVEDYGQKISEVNKQIVWFPVEELRREQKEIQRIYSEIEREIEVYNQSGQDTTESMMLAEIGGIDNEVENLESQKKEMEEIKEKYADNPIFNWLGWSDEIQENIDNVDQQIQDLTDKKREINIEISQIPINNYENYLNRLDNEAAILQDNLDNLDSSDMSQVDILYGLEENAKKRKATIHNELIFYQGELDKVKEANKDATY